MEMIADERRAEGACEDLILYLNLDQWGYRRIKTADQLEEKIVKQ